MNANRHELHGRSGTRLGATWTTLIVAQVAVAVAVLPAAVFFASRVVRMELAGAGFAAPSRSSSPKQAWGLAPRWSIAIAWRRSSWNSWPGSRRNQA